MKVLFIGDIYGPNGLEMFEENIEGLKNKYRPNIIIVNGENVTNGRGLSKNHYLRLMKQGVSAVTMGNWTYGNKELVEYIDNSNVIRPANIINAPGNGYKVINFNGKKLLVINVIGRVFIDPNTDNPFLLTEEIIQQEEVDYIFIDFHAEATSEKVAFGHHFDGIADAIVGTHTHVQTNDDRVLPKGTLYITDVGMTGPMDGVIGVNKELVINRFLTGYQQPNAIQNGPRQINGVFMDLDKKTIEKINIKE